MTITKKQITQRIQREMSKAGNPMVKKFVFKKNWDINLRKPCTQSHRELRLHLTPRHWNRFCLGHLQIVLKKSKHVGYGGAFTPFRDCEVPWCKDKATQEVYPSRKFIVSFWQPVKKRKGE